MESNTKSSSHASKRKFKVSCFTCSSLSSSAVTVQASSPSCSSFKFSACAKFADRICWSQLHRAFDLANNRFSDPLPDSLGHCSKKEILSLAKTSSPATSLKLSRTWSLFCFSPYPTTALWICQKLWSFCSDSVSSFNNSFCFTSAKLCSKFETRSRQWPPKPTRKLPPFHP